MQTSARETKVLGSAFLGNYASVKVDGSASTFTNEVRNCRFDANIGLIFVAGGVTFGGNGRFDVRACDFTRHYANQDMYNRKSAAVYLSLGASATADFADCLFSSNCVAGLSFGSVGVSGNGLIVFVSGLDQASPVIPEAFGNQWPHNRNKVVPRYDRPGMMLIVR